MTEQSNNTSDHGLLAEEVPWSSPEHETLTDAESGTSRQVKGAAAAGAVAGLLVGGPILCLVAAGGAYVCATSRSKAGDIARAGGDATADVGVKLKRLDRKHRIVEKTSRGVAQGCNWVTRKLQNDKPNNTSPETQLLT